MSQGYFSARASLYREALPIQNARIYIKTREADTENDSTEYDPTDDASRQNYDFLLISGQDGKTGIVAIDTPDESNSFNEAQDYMAYSVVDVYATAEGYIPMLIRGVQVFPGIESELPLNLEPMVSTLPEDFVRVYNIPQNAISSSPVRQREFSEGEITTDILSEVIVPSTIVVHLGAPGDNSAQDVTVPFTDYIKNVASSEIFPNWNEEAIRANVLAQISLALNRVYTEWYRSQGYNFQITNSTRYDQAFVNGRNIFDNISKIVDEIFNSYIVREGNTEPLFAQYCDGVRVNCDGMSQWGSQRLAEQGYSYDQILRRYYGDNISVVTTDNISDVGASYPGSPLSLGSVGEDVLRTQIQLNRIRRDYPLIKEITDINGRFDISTDEAVKTFQSIFNLTSDGIVGPATWYKISRIYSAVTDLAEITSEGTETIIPDTPPNIILRRGSNGPEVRLAQFILEYLSYFFPEIPYLTVDGYYGEETENSVTGFQKLFGITPDGIIGPETWEKLYKSSSEIIDTVNVDDQEQRYPGTPLGVGDRGRSVELMKIYYNRISNYYGGLPIVTVNEEFDVEFEEAIRQLQQRFGLDVDGKIGPLTWTRIVELYNFIDTASRGSATVSVDVSFPAYPGIPLRRGMNGKHIKHLQDALNKLSPGRSYISVNGEFSSETESAVREYQRKNGIRADGVVEEELWNKIMLESKTV